jgi:hypothetical protein
MESLQVPLACVIEKVCPPIVTVPILCEPGLAAAAMETVPFPVPLFPLVSDWIGIYINPI